MHGGPRETADTIGNVALSRSVTNPEFQKLYNDIRSTPLGSADSSVHSAFIQTCYCRLLVIK